MEGLLGVRIARRPRSPLTPTCQRGGAALQVPHEDVDAARLGVVVVRSGPGTESDVAAVAGHRRRARNRHRPLPRRGGRREQGRPCRGDRARGPAVAPQLHPAAQRGLHAGRPARMDRQGHAQRARALQPLLRALAPSFTTRRFVRRRGIVVRPGEHRAARRPGGSAGGEYRLARRLRSAGWSPCRVRPGPTVDDERRFEAFRPVIGDASRPAPAAARQGHRPGAPATAAARLGRAVGPSPAAGCG